MFAEDLTAFFNTDEHATAALYNSLTTINGIFNEADLGQLGVIAASNPTFLCAASDVAADPTGLALVVNSVSYLIRDIKPQDDGAVVLLELEQQ